jgi:Ricin-type beta-trefoil lectin domain
MFTKTRATIIALIASAGFATGSALVVPTVSHAYSAIIELQSNYSGKCLQPANGSQGAAIVQETCNGSLSQQWTQGPSEGSGGTSSNAEHYVDRSSGLCLDARGNATNGTPIEQWTCDWISNENWVLGGTQGRAELFSKVSSGNGGRCVSTPGLVNGDAMQLASCNGASSTYWGLSTARLAPPAITRPPIAVKPVLASSLG